MKDTLTDGPSRFLALVEVEEGRKDRRVSIGARATPILRQHHIFYVFTTLLSCHLYGVYLVQRKEETRQQGEKFLVAGISPKGTLLIPVGIVE